MAMRATPLLIAAALLLAWPHDTRAQIAWDTPRMVGPESPTGFGVYFLRSSALGPEMDAAMGTLGLPGTGGSVSVGGGTGIRLPAVDRRWKMQAVRFGGNWGIGFPTQER